MTHSTSASMAHFLHPPHVTSSTDPRFLIFKGDEVIGTYLLYGVDPWLRILRRGGILRINSMNHVDWDNDRHIRLTQSQLLFLIFFLSRLRFGGGFSLMSSIIHSEGKAREGLKMARLIWRRPLRNYCSSSFLPNPSSALFSTTR